jgi:hypothetical protein
LFAEWCAIQRVRLLDVKRTHLELFARHLEASGRMASTVAPRLIRSPTHSRWIAVSSARCWFRPGPAHDGITRWSRCWR